MSRVVKIVGIKKHINIVKGYHYTLVNIHIFIIHNNILDLLLMNLT